MRLASLPTLILAGVLASPTLWRGFVTGELEQHAALLRVLLAIPVAWLMLAFLAVLTNSYRTPSQAEDQKQPPLRVSAVAGEPMPQQRRASDRLDSEPPARESE